MVKRFIFTFLFTLYAFIFTNVAYYTLGRYRPDLLQIPAELTSEYMIVLVGIYTAIVVVSFYGAELLVYRRKRNYDKW